MACQTKVVGGHIEGAPIYGGERINEDGNSIPLFHNTLETAMNWLCDGFRSRFNQQRSLRSKFVYQDDEKIVDDAGQPVLKPIGSKVTDYSNSLARKNCSWLQAIPEVVLHAAVNSEKEEWFSAAKRRKKTGASNRMPGFRSSRHSNQSFISYRVQGTRKLQDGTREQKVRTAFHQTGSKSGVVVITGQNPKGKYAGRQFTDEEITSPKIKKPALRWKIIIRIRFNKSNVPDSWTSVNIDWTNRFATFSQPLMKRHEKVFFGSVVGIDRGGVKPMADSDGNVYELPLNIAALEEKRRNIQKSMARKKVKAEKECRNFWESGNYQREKLKYRDISRRISNIRDNWQHHLSIHLILNYDVIVLESLKIQSMTRRGTGKHGLNRSMLNVGHHSLLEKMKYKALLYGVEITEVPARYTSQRCSSCGFIAKENRESQAIFSCRSNLCEFTDNADLNAAKNILGLALGTWSNLKRD